MQLSLLDRFQGGLLGTWMAASLNKENNHLLEIDEQLLPWLKIVIDLTECLIEYGEITEDKWLRIWLQLGRGSDGKMAISSGAIALMTLPLALFCHDDPRRFKQYLYSLNQQWQEPQETLNDVILWQEAIALILQEKLKISSFIPQLLETCSKSSTFLEQQLKQVQTLIERKIPLHQGVSRLSRYSSEQLHPHEIALACYFFSYTPQEFSLCIKRAKHIDYQPSLTAILTGILAGVYNGLSGTPIAWRGELKNRKIFQELYRQAANLLAVWSGVDQSNSRELFPELNAEFIPHLSLQPLQYTAIASPCIIQSRITPS